MDSSEVMLCVTGGVEKFIKMLSQDIAQISVHFFCEGQTVNIFNFVNHTQCLLHLLNYAIVVCI